MRFEIEADPIAYILNGYSLHLGLTHGQWRHSIGTFAIEQPGFFLPNEAFDVFSRGVDVKTDYLFNKRKDGFFIGVQANYTWDRIEQGSSFSKATGGLNIGPRIGYRFFFNKKLEEAKGFYMAPWATYSYSTNTEVLNHEGEEYRPSSWFLFPTFHVGWRF